MRLAEGGKRAEGPKKAGRMAVDLRRQRPPGVLVSKYCAASAHAMLLADSYGWRRASTSARPFDGRCRPAELVDGALPSRT